MDIKAVALEVIKTLADALEYERQVKNGTDEVQYFVGADVSLSRVKEAIAPVTDVRSRAAAEQANKIIELTESAVKNVLLADYRNSDTSKCFEIAYAAAGKWAQMKPSVFKRSAKETDVKGADMLTSFIRCRAEALPVRSKILGICKTLESVASGTESISDKYSSDPETKCAVNDLHKLFKELKWYADQPEAMSIMARDIDFESVETFLSGNADASSVDRLAIENILIALEVCMTDTEGTGLSRMRCKPDDHIV